MNKLFSIESPTNGVELIEIFGAVKYGSEKGVYPVTIDGRLHTFRMSGNAMWIFGSLSDTMQPEIVTLVGGLIETTLK